MHFSDMPMVRFELDQLKMNIISQLRINQREYNQEIAARMDAAIEAYDWAAHVREAVHEALTSAIREYFAHGAGKDAIQEAVDSITAALKEGRNK